MRTSLKYILIIVIVVAFVHGVAGRYGTALRDPRFFDGWALAASMALQLLYHVKKSFPKLLSGAPEKWMQFHIYAGIGVVLLFAIHTSHRLPDPGFEWVLWGLFALVGISGLVGALLTRSIPWRLEQLDEKLELDDIPALRADLARRAVDISLLSIRQAGTRAVSNLYTETLHEFFAAQRNSWAHIKGSTRPLKRLLFEVGNVEREVDSAGQNALKEIKDLVKAKNRLDNQFANGALLKAWLFVHVPSSYALILMAIAHVAIVYAFRSTP